MPKRKRDPIHCTIAERHAGHVVLTINAIHPSVNDWMGKHWRTRQRMAKEWRDSIHEVANGFGMFTVPVKIVTTYHFPSRRHRDLGNYVPKFAIDGLIGALIPEDHSGVVRECTVAFGDADSERPRMVMEVIAA